MSRYDPQLLQVGGNDPYLLARLLILIEKRGLLHLKFGVGVGVNIYLWAR